MYNRASARRGEDVALDATFYQGGIPTDPFGIYRVEIYRGSVSDENIVAAIEVDPASTQYPLPLIRQPNPIAPPDICPGPGDCAESNQVVGSDPGAGRYRLVWRVPQDVVVPDVYFDVWYWFANDPGSPLTDHLGDLLKSCQRFWVYPDNWYVDGGMDTVRFTFEPIDIKFKKPERRPLEVGIMPLPLYDYNYNLVAPLIPYLEYSISIWTENDEPVVMNHPMTLKIRQGSYRSNPWVVSFMLDTCKYFKGTYKYRVKAVLPDGSSRVSGDFIFTVS